MCSAVAKVLGHIGSHKNYLHIYAYIDLFEEEEIFMDFLKTKPRNKFVDLMNSYLIVTSRELHGHMV